MNHMGILESHLSLENLSIINRPRLFVAIKIVFYPMLFVLWVSLEGLGSWGIVTSYVGI